MVDVTQEDRDAAANLIEHKCLPGDLTPTNIRIGNLDDGFAVQAFAEHRLATRPAPDGEPVADPTAAAFEVGQAAFDKTGATPALRALMQDYRAAHPPRNDAVVEALAVAAQELEACAPWMGDAAKGDILRAASHCRAQIAALKQGNKI